MLERARLLLVFFISSAVLCGCGAGLGSGGVANAPNNIGRRSSAIQQTTLTAPVLFVANLSDQVLIFPSDIHASNPRHIGAITQGVHRAQGLWVDHTGTLYVLNSNPVTVSEYKPGTMSPFNAITNTPQTANSIAVDAAGTLYLATKVSADIQIFVYPAGAHSASRVIQIPTTSRIGPEELAFDTKGNLLLATLTPIGQVGGPTYKIAPGSSNAVPLNLKSPPGGAIGTDALGNIYVGGPGGGISVYPPGSTSASRFIAAGNHNFYSNFAVTANGTVYWPNFVDGNMYEFGPGASSPTNKFLGGSGVDAAIGPR